ncbi:Signal-induced proliferation-associated 1-like protein 1 [Liparis tanakae]|uniref:Signal-induced proliferation-associated 1-like protein 1 n=1 Tax=Liparis tanakae TaxID=230148 RepID=A0A4Z2FZM0_9TELE|nr:Signal-induced proliferation-associated 1-like protein 1 [Liparis tanakae]
MGGHGTNPALDPGDDKSNDLVLSCPCFRNEIGGEGERNISSAKQPGSIGSGGSSSSSSGSTEDGPLDATLTTNFTNAGVAVLEAAKDGPSQHADRSKRYIVEHVDLGTYYYRKFFYLREHWNYLGVDENLGPVAVSLRREKLDEHKEHGQQYNYRVIFRTSELNTLRGSILEDAVPSTSKHGLARGLPLKEVLEYLVPELNVHCLRLALNTPKVTEQLMKLDEQGLSFQRKVGVMYCMAGQSGEEEMYNNESAGPALEEFLHLLGERVRLKGFTKYRAQLDAKTDSTGTHSMYTTYKDYEIMFHVSSMLPYTPNNKQQLLRKRHIGNDIVTIVFQEPGALPFTPKNIRSHFQHVFVVDLTSDLARREQQQLVMLEQLREIQVTDSTSGAGDRTADPLKDEPLAPRRGRGQAERRETEALLQESTRSREELRTRAQEAVRQWRAKCRRLQKELEEAQAQSDEASQVGGGAAAP